MLRDITLGQYYPADSVIHKLDPRTKLFATLLFIISVFSFDGIVGFIRHDRLFIWRDRPEQGAFVFYAARTQGYYDPACYRGSF